MSRNKKVLLPEARQALDSFKYEVADELGLSEKIKTKGWENMTSRECGYVGGMMVRKMVRQAESMLSNK